MMRSGPPRAACLPLFPPEMLQGWAQALMQAIAGGVKVIWYADRRVEFMSLDDMLRALDLVLGQLGCPAAQPRRMGACFSKGLTGGSWLDGGVEHQEVRDVLWSRDVPRMPGQVDDVDWEQR